MIGSERPAAAGLRAMYDNLARYQWLQRRLRRCAPGDGLEMHKRLAAPEGHGPAAGTAGLHAWIWGRLFPAPSPSAPRVLDVGCGFGATLLTFARAHAGSFVGLTPSGYQVARARAQAVALGVQARCEFRQQTYDEAIVGPFDGAVSVEALCHADVLASALRRIAASLVPGARLVAVEDVAVDATVADDSDGCELRQRWSTAHLHARARWQEDLAVAGFVLRAEHDLTAQVRPRPARTLARAARTLRWLRAALPTAGGRAVTDAFLGGVALERLYAKGAMRYIAFEAERAVA